MHSLLRGTQAGSARYRPSCAGPMSPRQYSEWMAYGWSMAQRYPDGSHHSPLANYFPQFEILQPKAPCCERDIRLARCSNELPMFLSLPVFEPNQGWQCLFGRQAPHFSMSSPLAEDLDVVFEGFDAGFNNDLEKGRKLCKFSGARRSTLRFRRV